MRSYPFVIGAYLLCLFCFEVSCKNSILQYVQIKNKSSIQDVQIKNKSSIQDIQIKNNDETKSSTKLWVNQNFCKDPTEALGLSKIL